MKKILWVVGGVVVLGVAWYLLSPLWRVVERHDPLVSQLAPDMPVTVAQGNLVAKAHEVKGNVKIVKNANNFLMLRFENFETINGPDLRVYLSSSPDSISDAIDLGAIKATKGEVNYSVPAGTDTAKYRYVLVWCRAFGVLFSFAELQ